jgi:hypothetical protein
MDTGNLLVRELSLAETGGRRMTTGVYHKSSSSETKWQLALWSTVLFGVTWYALVVGGMILFGIGADAIGAGGLAGRREAAALGDLMVVAGLAWLSNVVAIVVLRRRWRYASAAALVVAQMFAAAGALALMRLAAIVGITRAWSDFVIWCLLATVVGVELARMISRGPARP